MKNAASFLYTYRFFAGALVVACLVLGVGTALSIYRPLSDVVVTRTENGFVPPKITIRKGQSVVFKNESGMQTWPASNYHPSHGIYPAFDPKRPIDAGDSWRFTFDTAGVWNYHDHLDEYVRGTVTVVGSPGESTRECLLHTATTSASDVAACWAVQLTETLQTKGLQAAFDMYAQLYASNPSFRGLSCHDAGHILGAEAYKEYSNDHTIIDRPETSYCGYGFYHGFMEAMLTDQGTAQYLKVREYCNALKGDDNASGACFHGIGHAALDLTPGTLWGNSERMAQSALGVCENALVDTLERTQCSTGVFNAIALAASAHTYNLSFAKPDPLVLCSIQKEPFKAGCYKELGIGAIRENNLDRAGAIRFITSYRGDGGTVEILYAYAGDEAIRAINSFDAGAFHTFCNSFAVQKEREACNRGVLGGLSQGGLGSLYKRMFAYCLDVQAGTSRADCYLFAISQSKSTASDSNAFRTACEALPEPNIRDKCN